MLLKNGSSRCNSGLLAPIYKGELMDIIEALRLAKEEGCIVTNDINPHLHYRYNSENNKFEFYNTHVGIDWNNAFFEKEEVNTKWRVVESNKIELEEPELIPCPWCKTVPDLIWDEGGHGNGCFIDCDVDECFVQPRTVIFYKYDKETNRRQAIEVWNSAALECQESKHFTHPESQDKEWVGGIINKSTCKLTPFKCPNCNGSGISPLVPIAYKLEDHMCISCQGKGIVWGE